MKIGTPELKTKPSTKIRVQGYFGNPNPTEFTYRVISEHMSLDEAWALATKIANNVDTITLEEVY